MKAARSSHLRTLKNEPQNSAPIGIVVDSLGGGGAERIALVVAEGLAAAGHRVDLLLCTTRGHYLPAVRGYARVCTLHTRYWSSRRRELRRAVHPSVRVAHFGPRWSPLWFSWLRVAARLPGIAPALCSSKQAHTALAAADYIRRERPRALLALLEGGEVAALLGNRLAAQKTRVVVSFRCAMVDRKPGALRFAKNFLPSASAFTAVSDGLAGDAAHEMNLPREKIRTIYNPVAVPASLAAAAPAHAWFKDSSVAVILAAGRLFVQKDFPTLLRAFARLANQKMRLVIAGEGGERLALENLASELGIAGRVDFPGWVANPFALMSRARLFVLSSRYEGLSNVLIEALACGCPVVSTDCPHGSREILENGKWGALVPVGDDAALAAAMEDALRTQPDRGALRGRAEFFTVERTVREYEKILVNGGGITEVQ